MALLAELGRSGGAFRSSCTARVQGDVTVRIPSPARYGVGPEGAQMQAHP
jgi:hypothetical protein